MKTKLILVSAFGLLFSACTTPVSTPNIVPTSTQPVETVLPTSESASTPEPTQPPVQVEPSPTTENLPTVTMTTYTDDYAGFSLDYPANWYLESSALAHAEESIGYSISVASWDILHPPAPTDKNPDGIPEGGAKIDVTVLKQSMRLEEAVDQQAQTEDGGTILARKDVTLANGLPAVILDLEGMIGPVRTLITVLNGNVIYVSGYGDLEPYESIAMTLRAR